jgi:mono/diheme cytochrome c family protein
VSTNRQSERPNKEHAGYRVLLAMTSCLALWMARFTFVALPRLGQAESGDRGKELFEKRCSGCHVLDKDKEGLACAVPLAAPRAGCRRSSIRTRLRQLISLGMLPRSTNGYLAPTSSFRTPIWLSNS